jgi:hypothetical protein
MRHLKEALSNRLKFSRCNCIVHMSERFIQQINAIYWVKRKHPRIPDLVSRFSYISDGFLERIIFKESYFLLI